MFEGLHNSLRCWLLARNMAATGIAKLNVVYHIAIYDTSGKAKKEA